jgi:hypothetical protein
MNPLVEETRHADFPQLISQGVPNWSTSTPKRAAQKVSWIGICTAPFSASAAKTRSASAASSRPSYTEMPAGL